MDKQTIITLLRKDIAELLQLTEGFDQMTQCPRVLIDLALQKTHSVETILKELLLLPQQTEVETNVTVRMENKEEIAIERTPVSNTEEQIYTETQPQVQPEEEVVNESPVEEHPIELVVEEQTVENEEVTVTEEVTIQEESIVTQEEIAAEQPLVENLLEEPLVEELMEDLQEVEESEPELKPELEENKEVEVEETEKVEYIEVLPKTEILTRNDSIVNSKIEDISKVISLGDRFLFQRELFANNGESMQKTIQQLNTLSSIEEAQTYLLKKFSWDKESATVERFMQLISRRYL